MIGHNSPPDDERNSGWVAIQRDIIDHPIIGIHDRPFTDFEAWLYLLCNAAHTPREVLNKGSLIVLDPGQIMSAHGFLSTRWLWSVDKVRHFVKKLEAQAMIARYCAKHPNRRNTNQIQIITICNYSKYQFIDNGQHQAKYQPKPQANTKPTPSEHQANPKNLTLDRPIINNRDKEEEGSFGADAPPVPSEVTQAWEGYNELALRLGLPIARTLTPQRRKNLTARLNEHGGIEAWRIALANIERSAFLRGRNDRGWKADFDFLLQASRFAKVVDGTYGNGAHGDVLEPEETQMQRLRRLCSEETERLEAKRVKGLLP